MGGQDRILNQRATYPVRATPKQKQSVEKTQAKANARDVIDGKEDHLIHAPANSWIHVASVAVAPCGVPRPQKSLTSDKSPIIIVRRRTRIQLSSSWMQKLILLARVSSHIQVVLTRQLRLEATTFHRNLNSSAGQSNISPEQLPCVHKAGEVSVNICNRVSTLNELVQPHQPMCGADSPTKRWKPWKTQEEVDARSWKESQYETETNVNMGNRHVTLGTNE